MKLREAKIVETVNLLEGQLAMQAEATGTTLTINELIVTFGQIVIRATRRDEKKKHK